MPNVSTYIRTEDLSKYLEIAKDKGAWTEFIHNALNPGLTEKMLDDTLQELADKGIKPGLHPKKPKADICKQHGIDKNLCRMMKH